MWNGADTGAHPREYAVTRRGTRIPPAAWTQRASTAPGLVDALAASDRFRAFADDFPARTRASPSPRSRSSSRPCTATLDPPARLPPRRGRGGARRSRRRRLVRRSRSRVALLPSRGVRAGSGLEPPAHLVGERAAALDVLERGGLVCVSARALAEGMPPEDGATRSRAIWARGGVRPRRARRVTRARGLRARRARRGARTDRGARRARRRLPEHGPRAAPRRVLRRRLEQIRAFSPFTQRALHAVDEAVVFPARERMHLDLELAGRPTRSTGRSRPAARPSARPRLAARRRRRRVARGRARLPPDVVEARPARCASALASRTSSRRSARRSPRAASRKRRTSSRRWCARDDAVLVTFPHPGEALRTQRLLRRVEARVVDDAPRAVTPDPSLTFVVSPARRGFVWRDLGVALLPDTQVFRKRPPRATRGSAARSSPSPTFASATTSCTRTTASGAFSASRRRTSRASRATTSSSRSRARTGSTSRTSRSRRSRATSGRTRRRRRSRSSAARRGRTSRAARARRSESSPASSSPSTRSVDRRPARRSTSRATGSSGSRARSRIARPTTSSRRSRR